MRKKILSIILVITMLSLSACGLPTAEPEEDAGGTTVETETNNDANDDGTEVEVDTDTEADTSTEADEELEVVPGDASWQDAENIEITMLTRWAEGISNMFDPLTASIESFEAQHPNVTIDHVPIGGADDTQFYERMRTAAAVGDMFNIFINYGGSTIRSFVEAGIILDLQPSFDADPEWRDSFLDIFGMWEYDFSDGVYGLPLFYFATVLYVNTLLFEEHGLEVPTNLTELEAVSEAFLEAGVTPIPRSGEGWRWGHWATSFIMQSYGSELIYGLANRTHRYDGPEMMGIAERFLDWQSRGFFGDNIASLDSQTESLMFAMGESPMIAIGTWLPQTVSINNPDLIPYIDVVWFPYNESFPEMRYGAMGGPNEGLSISIDDDPNVTAATLAFLKYLTSEDTVTRMWEVAPYSLFSVRTVAPPAAMNDLTRRSMELIHSVTPLLMHEMNMYDPIAGMQDIVRNAYAGMMAGGSAEEAMGRIQSEIDAHDN